MSGGSYSMIMRGGAADKYLLLRVQYIRKELVGDHGLEPRCAQAHRTTSPRFDK